jgi:hypothetical protein
MEKAAKKTKAVSVTITMLAAAVLLLMPVVTLAGDLEPTGPPSSGTMHSLEDIHSKIEVLFNAFTISPDDVCAGKVYLGLRPDGTIGEITGVAESLDCSSGDDTFVWSVTEDGNITINGGEGNDTLLIHGVSDIHGGWHAGEYSIELTDNYGYPVDPGKIETMFDAEGSLLLPDHYSGVITGPGGNTVTFDGVEKISVY